MRRVFLGVDCGTQSTKVVLRDGVTGEVVAVGRARHELIERDDGTREQDPAWWIDALRIALRDAVRGERFDIGGIKRVMELTGNLLLPGYTAPKIAWLIAHEPDAYARTARMCLPHDYLNLWLTGEFVTEAGDASGTAYFDVRRRRYSETVVAAIDA